MRSLIHRRTTGALAVVLVTAAVAASCTAGPNNPVPPPVQPVYDWEARATTMHVVDDNNDNFLCDGWPNTDCDEPYLLHLAFRVQYGVADSADTWVVHDRPNEIKCVGAPPSRIVLGLETAQVDSCKSGESAPVPAAQGVVLFDDLKASDVENLVWQQLPEIAGVLTFAFEEDLFSSSNPDTSQLETFLLDILNDTIANTQLEGTGSGTGSGETAANDIVTDLANIFGDLLSGTAISYIAGVGLLDDFIGVAPVVIAGVQGTLAGLVTAAGLATVPLLNGQVFTTAATNSFTALYTAQTIEFPPEMELDPITIGASGARYDVDWTVGIPTP